MPVNVKGEIDAGGRGSPGAKAVKKTMPRLKGFNYRRPFFYMVTLKRRAGLSAFSQITEEADPPKDARGLPRYLFDYSER